MPRGGLIVLAVAMLLIVASILDRFRDGGGSSLARKTWLRTAAIMIVVSLVITYIHRASS